MKPRTLARAFRWLKKLLRSGLTLLKAITVGIRKFCQFAVRQILTEITLAILVIGFSYLLMAWGMPLNAAFILAIALTSAIVAVVGIIWLKFSTNSKLKGELRLSHLITKALTHETSREWDEYQDWLHDIMLSRHQLLDNQCPQWKVSLITYRRLSAFCIVVGISKVKHVAASIRRSL
ncbi:MAG: hypothetical protein AAGE84_16305 [Cyanobacteria bacterium P01_G01_bin.39]